MENGNQHIHLNHIHIRNVPISPLVTPFSSGHGSTHYLQTTKLQYVNSSTTAELQIKMTIDK